MPSSLRLASPLRDTPPTPTNACRTVYRHCLVFRLRSKPATLGMQHTKMMFHSDQHDMRIFQAKMPFILGSVQRALTFGIRIQRVIAIRMLIIGNRPSSNDGSSATCR